ncbi:MAG TPA: methylmalonate-semialdehyde dehydrogenase (CoA acylating) [Nocardioides bacterium]|nr:methylmalonate-semialdehyde dehydrogenase (CoA acylating) [Nocardioides sp.]
MTDVVGHWLSGAPFEGTSGRWADVTNPATGAVTGRVALASRSDADQVIAAADAAAGEWRRTSLARRTQVLFAFRELLNSRRGELAELITAEHGKVLSDAIGEIARGQEVVEFACGISHLLKGGHSESVSSGVDVHSKRDPLGVVGIISPFNFPAMVPMWFFPIAIAAGNAVVLKPSEKDPSAALWLAHLWKEAGLPDGVFNVLQGDKEAVDALLESPIVQSISFVGSTPVAEYVYEQASRHGKRVQALGGAKNHMVVLPDADLDLAADAAVSAGYGSAGERCMAISVVVAVGPAADELVARVADRTRTLLIGDGGADATADSDREADMGPLVTRAHRDRVASFIEIGEQAGAKVVVDGREVAARGAADGFWLGPTLFDHVTPDMDIYREEIFGPVLAIMHAKDFDDALRIANSLPYKLTGGVFSRKPSHLEKAKREFRVGNLYLNRGITGALVARQPFGGFAMSGGGTKAGGRDYLLHFVDPRLTCENTLRRGFAPEL